MRSSLASACKDVSAMPVTVWLVAVRRLSTTATASSSSSSSGGSADPAPSRYPPATPGLASIGYPSSRSRTISRRNVRTVTWSRCASSAPDHSGRRWRIDSSRSRRADVSSMN
jgi:hypothetical protein